jgi:PAS domain S-box-containing protein
MDDDLNLMLANNRFLEMYGLPAALGTPGTPLAALFRHQIDHRPTGSGGAVEDPGKLVAEGLAHVRGTAERHLEETRPDGRVIELYRRPMEGGGLVTTYSDITRLKRAEREAKASEARFRAILEAHPVPVVITWLDDGELFYASPRTLEIFRLAGGDGNAGEAWRAADFHASAAEHERVRGHLREHGRIELMETAMRRRDGLVFPAAISARTIEFEGRMAAVMGIHDLSDSKRAEAEIERQREALVQSEKLAALGSLLAGVAHELNNPLSVVVGQSVLLEETAPDEATEIRARKIHRAADRCARIVRTFLSLARRSPPERQQVDLNEIVQAAVELVTYSLHADGVELTMDPPREPALLWGDADQLNQVVTNLVVNARQALQTAPRPRRLAIRVRLDRDDPEAPTIRLSVADNGPGVPAEIRTRIFDPFFTTKPAGIGTGVGLSMCHNIIDSHGGTVELDETPGGGATFLVTLPARRSAPADFAASTGELPAVMTPLRLLIVDDDPEIALTVAEMLAPDNHDIAIAENGAAALARLDEEPFDMVISDIRMPELDGPGLYRHLAIRHPRLLDRICFVTGDTLSEGVRDFLNETGVPVLEKPYEPADLRAMVARLVGKLGESQ